MRRPWPLGLAVAMLVTVVFGISGCSDGSSQASCADRGRNCNLREASEELGVFVGTTSEAPGWTRNEIGTLVGTHFSSVTSQNELKWGSLVRSRGQYDFERADETVAFAENQGLRMRGHTLFWHRGSGTPGWVSEELGAAADPEARLRELMQEHVETVMSRYRGRIEAWDVINEPLDVFSGDPAPESIYFQTFERYEDFLDLAFESARQADPRATLFLNEIFAGTNEAKFEGLLELVRGMISRGTPIDGVGFQGHFITGLPDRDALERRLQAFADLGLRVEITELDVSINLVRDQPNPKAAQADVYREVVDACLAVVECTAITTWNVHDGLTWLDRDALFANAAPHEPTLFDSDLSPKPAYHAVLDAFIERLPR